jgi:hypothetical protein
MAQPPAKLACIGLRAKTARAIAVVLLGPGESPQAVMRSELVLATPATPALFQPYHEVMDLPWNRAVSAVRTAERSIEVAASTAIKALVAKLQSAGITACSVGVVGAPERNLESIGSPHIRAHAAEGVLFRHVLEVGAAANNLRCAAFSESDFDSFAASRLGLSVGALRGRVAEFGQALGRPWRADEKLSAIAAWLALPADDKV